MIKNFVGFYWTLPVPQIGFRTLPRSVDEAAKRSRTIAYQRQRVIDEVTKRGGKLADEFVFMEFRPDAGTPHIVEELSHAVAACQKLSATLAVVRFDDSGHWRENSYLKSYLIREAPVDSIWIEPRPVYLDGKIFDPVEHFLKWRKIAQNFPRRAEIRNVIIRELVARASSQIFSSPPDYAGAAKILNRKYITTTGGKSWDRDNLRHFINNHEQKILEFRDVVRGKRKILK